MGDMRCFLALDLPDPLLRHLTSIQTHYASMYPHFRWVKRENLHLTLHFLGEISRKNMDQLVTECRPVSARNQALAVRAGELGVFPRWSAPAVLWLSLTGDMEKLKLLHEQTAGAVKRAGLTTDNKPFRPHITLARMPANRKEGLDPAVFQDFSPDSQEIYALSTFTLYTSELKPQGPVYRPYFRFELNKGS